MANQSPRSPRAWIGITALVGAIALAAFRLVPMALAGAYLAMSFVSYLLYRSDKRAARRNARRRPEGMLHLADLLGGWPGALVAQQQFRHKTIKQPFQVVFWVTVVLNLAGAYWIGMEGDWR